MHLLEEGGHSGNSCYSPVLVHAGTRHVARELLWRSPGFDTHTPCRLTKHINNDSFGETLRHRSPFTACQPFSIRSELRSKPSSFPPFQNSPPLPLFPLGIVPITPSRFPDSGNESEGKLEGRKEGGLVENNWGKKRLTGIYSFNAIPFYRLPPVMRETCE